MTQFNGLVQHSFALRLPDAHHPFDGHSTGETVAERFEAVTAEGDRFGVVATRVDGGADAVAHTLLARTDLTSVVPSSVGALADDTPWQGCEERYQALSWAGPGEIVEGAGQWRRDRSARPRMIFARREGGSERIVENDFLVQVPEPDAGVPGAKVARHLLDAVAYRRSQLFGLAISNRFVNVMLPCATLTPRGEAAAGPLLLLALVSLMRDGADQREFRRMYSLTLYALPVQSADDCCPRAVSKREIESLVNAGWGLADAIPRAAVPAYGFAGPLRRYVKHLAGQGATALLNQVEEEEQRGLSLRMVSELIAYAVALRMAQGSRGKALDSTKRAIGDDVVTTLGTARVSAALVVDPELEPERVTAPISWTDPPGSLKSLLETLSPATRVPATWDPAQRRKLRLDRPFVDSGNHAAGVIPANRCLVVAYVRREVRSDPVPLLSLVAGVTFMTAATATAIGTLRSIDRDLERLEREGPRKIAEIDGEVATDLHEIYDLDISNETYRNLYRRLRDRLGITQDYKTLQEKMQTLYRATSTFHDEREQKQLAWLTAGIVILSVLILIGTIIVAAR